MKSLFALLLLGCWFSYGFQDAKNPAPLTRKTVKAALEAAGYKVTETSPGVVFVTLTPNGATVPVSVSVSDSGRYIWLIVNLGDITKAELADSKWLSSLLLANQAIQPAAYSIYSQTTDATSSSSTGKAQAQHLEIDQPLPNAGYSDVDLRKEIEALGNLVASEKSRWAYSPSKN